MAHPKKQPAKQSIQRNAGKPPVYKPGTKASSLFDSLNNWFGKRSSLILFSSLGLSLLFSILLFQARMDMGGDDSAYILKAYDFLHKGAFPTYQAPFYPIVLSLFIAILGVKVVWLKIVSILFNLAALYILYKAFKDRLPAFVFLPVLLITALNSSLDNFASLTYSEAFFMLLQASTLFFFFRLMDKLEKVEYPVPLKDNYKDWLLVGFFVFALSFARNIGFAGLLGFMIYFAIRRQFKYVFYLAGAVLVFQIPLVFLEKVVWHLGSQWKDQGATLMLKDPYDPSKGNDDFTGFFVRFFGNCNLYLSKRFFQILGFRSPDSTDTSPFLAFIVIVLGLLSFYRIFKAKNPHLLASILYTAGMVAGSFFALQTRWDQPRIIMVFVPLLLFLILYGLYDALKQAWIGQILFLLAFMLPIFIANLTATIKDSKANITTLQKNIQGDIFYGYTPDWVNYLKMSQWCADNLPKDASVAVRKAPISFIYTGKEFYPIYKAYYTQPDSVLNYFRKNKVDYVVLASLRMNPNVNDGNIVNTIQQMIGPVEKAYPQKLKVIHQEGTDEPATLVQIVQ